MDFTRTEAALIFRPRLDDRRQRVHPEHQRSLDTLDQRFDTALRRRLIDADILSTAAPESVGGGGYGCSSRPPS